MGSVNCSQGEILPLSSHCNNSLKKQQCYNSYQDSHNIGVNSHYTCPDTCVALEGEMCQGVSWCGSDVQECGPQLRCYNYDDYPVNNTHILKSTLVTDHHFCAGNTNNLINNNGVFDHLDRSDEHSILSSMGTSFNVDNTQFPVCGYGKVMCGSDCKDTHLWCTSRSSDNGTCGLEAINKGSRICGNPLVLGNLSCIDYYGKDYGMRCSGSNQECIYPWYLSTNNAFGESVCSDKSDQKFTIGLTCSQHVKAYIKIHNENFCKNSYICLLYTSPSPRDGLLSRMPSSA